ncbi:MAG TPA: YidC/Oxa1 family membrane protein insertase [Actinomycetota bacterium]|nr:YidC/Oxa1 family membrane protein insertase [Actinomycetota bacterium]
MIAVVWWQAFLDGLGAVLSFFYDLIPNYGVAVILLTLAIRVLLLPLAVKQIRSMQAMQAIQPKVKELQRKYKGNRERMNQEMMALYKEHGVNPLSGCLPLLAQLPALFALYAILRFPVGLTHIPHNEPNPVVSAQSGDSRLYVDILQQRTSFLGTNLLCSASQAGQKVAVGDQGVPDAKTLKLDCGDNATDRIPYYILIVLMVGTTYYQQRQMQRATPSGANQQQQMLTRIMPFFFGFIGYSFPAALVVYWTTTNLVQIVQQQFTLPKPPPPAAEKAPGAVEKKRGDGQARPGQIRKPSAPAGDTAPRGAKDGGDRQRSGEARTQQPSARSGRNARDRKKRRKR